MTNIWKDRGGSTSEAKETINKRLTQTLLGACLKKRRSKVLPDSSESQSRILVNPTFNLFTWCLTVWPMYSSTSTLTTYSRPTCHQFATLVSSVVQQHSWWFWKTHYEQNTNSKLMQANEAHTDWNTFVYLFFRFTGNCVKRCEAATVSKRTGFKSCTSRAATLLLLLLLTAKKMVFFPTRTLPCICPSSFEVL